METTEASSSGTSEKPFACNIDGCNRAYKTKGNLKTHQKIHSGQFSFYCDYEGCDKGFVSAYSFKVHYRHHTGRFKIHCIKFNVDLFNFQSCSSSFFGTIQITYNIYNK